MPMQSKNAAILIGLMAVAFAVVLFMRPPKVENGGNPPEKEAAKPPELPIIATLPEFTLTDQTGADFGMRELREKVWIANFIFTKCQATCPRQTAELKKLQEKLKTRADWPDIRLVSISVDPENDTPEVLTTYASENGADPEHWKFLTGDREKIWELSKKGFMLAVGESEKDAASPLFHSPYFVLVDFYGRIRGFYDSATEDGTSGAKGLVQLSQDIDRVFEERIIELTPSPTPAEVIRPSWLADRQKKQLATAKEFQTFHGFQFEDRLETSGITFRHKAIDDAGKLYEAAHYDHGTGMSIADVDGDGRYDLYFVNQAGSNELWKNLGGGRFENITESAGVALTGRISVAAAFADIDNDGDADLYVTTVRHGNVLFENDGHGKFKDITTESGLDFSGHSSGAVFFDFNRDGLVDLFLTNLGVYTTDETHTVTMEPWRGEKPAEITYYKARKDAFQGHLFPARRDQSILYKNLGKNRFADVSKEVNLVDESWTGDASPLDVNNDGWPDLYILSMQGHNEYYENIEGRRFEKKSLAVFPETPWGAMGIKVFDFDNDGRMDIFITDMHSDMSDTVGPEREKVKSRVFEKWPESLVQAGQFNPQPGRQNIYGNAFFHNEGGGRFKEISDKIGAETFWPWGLSVGDMNADGFDDVFITASMNYPFRYAVNSLLLNESGKRFRDSEFILGVEPRRNGRTATPWFEIECDGKDREYCKERNLSGRHMVWSALGSRSSVIFDIDDDGDLDIVTNEFNAEPMVLVSNLAEKNQNMRFLKIKLIGKASNRDGLGARVNVRAAGKSYAKVYDGLSGYLGHSLYPLYFGLGETAEVESIEVVWPDGVKQVVEGPLETNRLIEIAQP